MPARCPAIRPILKKPCGFCAMRSVVRWRGIKKFVKWRLIRIIGRMTWRLRFCTRKPSTNVNFRKFSGRARTWERFGRGLPRLLFQGFCDNCQSKIRRWTADFLFSVFDFWYVEIVQSRFFFLAQEAINLNASRKHCRLVQHCRCRGVLTQCSVQLGMAARKRSRALR